jgi:hypothetical protein
MSIQRLEIRMRPGLPSMMFMLFALADFSAAATPVSYRRTIHDPAGVSHRVNFSGQAESGRLTGVLTVDGDTVDVIAHFGKDRSVSGRLMDRVSGARGAFWGVLDKDQLLGGHFNIGGQGGRWEAPGFTMPIQALPTDDPRL